MSLQAGPVAWCFLGAVGEQGVGLELLNSSSWAGRVPQTPALALRAGTWLCRPSWVASRDCELGQNWSAGLATASVAKTWGAGATGGSRTEGNGRGREVEASLDVVGRVLDKEKAAGRVL